MTGDGHADVALGCPGCDADGRESGLLLLVQGPVAPGTYDADEVSVVGLGPGHLVGEVLLGPGDVTGDGRADLLLGMPADATDIMHAGALRVLPGWQGPRISPWLPGESHGTILMSDLSDVSGGRSRRHLGQ